MTRVNQLPQNNNQALELYELLVQNPSIFGRLLHIAGFWNPLSNRYDIGLPERFRGAGLDQQIARWHHAFFMEWVALSLAQQQNDVLVYWNSTGRSPEQIKNIREQGEAAIPALVEWAERRSFRQNLAFIQSVLAHQSKASITAA